MGLRWPNFPFKIWGDQILPRRQNFDLISEENSSINFYNEANNPRWPNNFLKAFRAHSIIFISPSLRLTERVIACISTSFQLLHERTGTSYVYNVSRKWFFVTLIQSCGSVKWFHFSLCPLGCEYFHKARKANYFGHWYKLNLTFDVGIKSVILKICKTDEILFRSHAITTDLNPFQFAMLIVKAKIIIIFFS